MKKEYTQLTDKERYHLELLLQECPTQKLIAERLGRDKSTISRELKRNRMEPGYFSDVAIESISERPARVSHKKEAFHWEGDTVEGKGHMGGVATLVDMKTKFLLIRKVRDKSAVEMKDVIVNSFINCPGLMKSLTLDNGKEFALHDVISKDLNTDVYFANPYSPWERGLNENTNGLIRRFYPKGTDFTKITERDLLKTQDMLNDRPRKCLGYKTPKEVFIKEVFKNHNYKDIVQQYVF